MADISKAKAFGFEPESNFKNELMETIKWFDNKII